MKYLYMLDNSSYTVKFDQGINLLDKIDEGRYVGPLDKSAIFIV
jgi:hypothetical protein